MAGQRRLRDGAETERLRRQHEIADIGPAVDRAVDAERLVGVNDGDMGRADEIVILQRLPGVGGLVAARDAEGVVELEAALAAAFEIDAEIFTRRREVMAVVGARCGRGVDRFAKTLLGLAARDQYLPRLAVAPGRGALRHGKHMRDGFARHRIRPKRPDGIAFLQQFLEHADTLLAAVPAGRRARDGVFHLHLPLVGILLNGTSLSTRMSPGRPSTRSAMMLRRISSVPPAIRIDGEFSSICWNWPRASSSASPVKTPAAPSRSIA